MVWYNYSVNVGRVNPDRKLPLSLLLDRSLFSDERHYYIEVEPHGSLRIKLDFSSKR